VVNHRKYGRSDRVADLIRREVADIIIRGDLDRDIGFVTVTRAEVSRDLQNAKIYISVLGDKDVREREFEKLLEEKKRIRYLLAQRLNLRHTPIINLYMDDSLDNSIRVQQILKNIDGGEEQE